MNGMGIRIWLTAAQRRHLEMAFCMALLVLGCIGGTLCMRMERLHTLCRLLTQMCGNRLLDAFGWNGCALLGCLFLGFCAVGQPLLCMIPLLFGFRLGCMLTSLSTGMAIHHLAQYLLTAAFSIVASFFLLLGVRESLRMSCVYLRLSAADMQPEQLSQRIRLYLIRHSILLMLTFTASGLYAILCRVLL